MTFTYRLATPADKAEALAISAHFVNDWLGFGYDIMVKERRLYVAVDSGGTPAGGDRLAAVCAYSPLGSTTWLEAMRVHPDYHRQGLATAFTLYLMEECRRAGFRRARLDTAIDNHPVHKMMAKMGFRARGNFRLSWQPAAASPPLSAPADPSAVRPGTPADAEAAWAFLARRAAEGKLETLGLASALGHIFEVGDLEKEDLAGHLAAGHVLLAMAGPAGAIAGPASPAPAIAGLAIWSRMIEPGAGDNGEDLDHTDVAYLEGEPAVQAALLTAVFETASRTAPGGPTAYLELGLPESQWLTITPQLHPDWVARPDDTLAATVYEKDL